MPPIICIRLALVKPECQFDSSMSGSGGTSIVSFSLAHSSFNAARLSILSMPRVPSNTPAAINPVAANICIPSTFNRLLSLRLVGTGAWMISVGIAATLASVKSTALLRPKTLPPNNRAAPIATMVLSPACTNSSLFEICMRFMYVVLSINQSNDLRNGFIFRRRHGVCREFFR